MGIWAKSCKKDRLAKWRIGSERRCRWQKASVRRRRNASGGASARGRRSFAQSGASWDLPETPVRRDAYKGEMLHSRHLFDFPIDRRRPYRRSAGQAVIGEGEGPEVRTRTEGAQSLGGGSSGVMHKPQPLQCDADGRNSMKTYTGSPTAPVWPRFSLR